MHTVNFVDPRQERVLRPEKVLKPSEVALIFGTWLLFMVVMAWLMVGAGR